ncbi:AAA family ATPase [Staphylothermus hellenicus]|uniref:ATPase associated with various cellular activities AAA_3 n=1 Tax=Staphylothermus hellenicus (strain DSM 12710 / JCM 10830 / BK20S6-10-b1 / P8) TaxID=591019 RepID=D7DBF0_STAHD|nr:MoxR family ATPase [Staphylothermus hellenicus]ADI31497.1 ATPase associated with various cellular activities AAA_3 [Staphylothermus hellenicus DSM 12710]
MQNTLSNKDFDPGFASSISRKIIENASKIIVGKKDVIRYILISIYAGGHILLEGVPGVAKTLIAKTIARSLSLSYSRIQATPDLLPSDIIGTLVFDPRVNDFRPRKGPIFANIVLFDEINRASPRTQSALLEAMQEKQVTIEGITFKLPEPFIVIATMNPIEMEGTFPLPEAQLDRFLLKIIVSYPDTDEEKEVLRRIHYIEKFNILPVTSAEEILAIKAMLPKVNVSEELIDYIVSIVKKTREHPHVRLGGSPRASISLLLTSKANALIDGRSYVIPDDIKFVAKPVLRHRIILRPEAEFEGITTDQIIEDILNETPVPTPGVQS